MILKFCDIYLYQIGNSCYNFIKMGKLTSQFRQFYIFPCRTNFQKFSIQFQDPKFFNSLKQEIQDSESISLIAKRLKMFLLI